MIWRLHYYDAIFIDSLFSPSRLFHWQKDFFPLLAEGDLLRDMATGSALREFLSKPLHSNHFYS